MWRFKKAISPFTIFLALKSVAQLYLRMSSAKHITFAAHFKRCASVKWWSCNLHLFAIIDLISLVHILGKALIPLYLLRSSISSLLHGYFYRWAVSLTCVILAMLWILSPISPTSVLRILFGVLSGNLINLFRIFL